MYAVLISGVGLNAVVQQIGQCAAARDNHAHLYARGNWGSSQSKISR